MLIAGARSGQNAEIERKKEERGVHLSFRKNNNHSIVAVNENC
jgi:hypothetical protein